MIRQSLLYVYMLVGYDQNTIIIEYLITNGETEKLVAISS